MDHIEIALRLEWFVRNLGDAEDLSKLSNRVYDAMESVTSAQADAMLDAAAAPAQLNTALILARFVQQVAEGEREHIRARIDMLDERNNFDESEIFRLRERLDRIPDVCTDKLADAHKRLDAFGN